MKLADEAASDEKPVAWSNRVVGGVSQGGDKELGPAHGG